MRSKWYRQPEVVARFDVEVPKRGWEGLSLIVWLIVFCAACYTLAMLCFAM